MTPTIPNLSTVWGIDPSSLRFALAIKDLDGRGIDLVSADVEGDLPQRLHKLFVAVTDVAIAAIEEHGFPVCICTEKPIARMNTSAVLLWGYGVTLAALVAANSLYKNDEIAWLEVEQAAWKKHAGLNYNADDHEYCALLRSKKIPFDNPDQAAAWFIADYAVGRISR